MFDAQHQSLICLCSIAIGHTIRPHRHTKSTNSFVINRTLSPTIRTSCAPIMLVYLYDTSLEFFKSMDTSASVPWPTDHWPLFNAIAHILLDKRLKGIRCTPRLLIMPLNAVGGYDGRELNRLNYVIILI